MVTKNTRLANVVNLRKTSPNSIKCIINKSTYQKHEPRKNDLYIRDTRDIGFYIRIRPNSKTTYCCEAKLGGIGKKITMTIGDGSLFTAQQARKIAKEHLRKIKSGINPKDEIKQSLAKGQTLEKLAKEYIVIRDHLAENTKKDYVYRVPQQLGRLANKDIRELTVDDFVSWWGKAKAKGSRKVALRYVSSLLSYAMARKYIDENVAQDFRRGVLGGIPESPPRQTHISKLEIEDWIISMIKISPVVEHCQDKAPNTLEMQYWETPPKITETQRDYILFLLITGKRAEEVASLKWKDISMKKNDETITIEKTKSGKVDVLPMTNLLWHMLNCRKKKKDKHTTYIFPNKYRSGPIVDVRKSLEKINNRTGIGHITRHDLRRTFATMTKELGMTNEDTAILLNHAKRDVTEGYIITSRIIKRDNLDRVTKLMFGHLQGWIKYYWYNGNEGWLDIPEPEEEGREYYV